MTIHVLLTADNHLDPSAVQYGPKRFERKRDFQRCFEILVNFALENKPDILLIGGDFYDGILPGNPTRAFVAEQFKRLHFPDTLSNRRLRRLLWTRSPHPEILHPQKPPTVRLRPPAQSSKKNHERDTSRLSRKHRASLVQ